MTITTLGVEADAATRILAEAVRLARAIAVPADGARIKDDASPVTVVDFAVQALVAERLAHAFPRDLLVAEEDAAALRAPGAEALLAQVTATAARADAAFDDRRLLAAIDRGRGEPGLRFWTLDPVDGTKGLLRGGQFVVALALVVGHEVQVGAIGCPRLGVPSGTGSVGGVAVAARGRGSWWVPLDDGAPRPLRVSAVADAARARLTHSVEESHSDRGRMERVRQALGSLVPPVLLDSQAKHVVIAAGEADVLVRFPRAGYHEAIWDIAAGALLIEEAGGRVTDLAGRPLDFSTGRRLTGNVGLVATNGRLHDAVLAADQGRTVSAS